MILSTRCYLLAALELLLLFHVEKLAADTLRIETVKTGLICLQDFNDKEVSNSFLIQDFKNSILIDAGWSEKSQLPNEIAQLIDEATKVATHFHYDHIRKWHQMKNIKLSLKQAAYCVDSKCSPTRWATIKNVLPFKVSGEVVINAPVVSGGSRVISIECSGHSQTDLCFIDKKTRTLFIGDIFYEGPVFYFLPGGSFKKAKESIDRLLARNDWDNLAQAHGNCVISRDKLVQFAQDIKNIESGIIEWAWNTNFVLPLFDYKVRMGSILVRPIFR